MPDHQGFTIAKVTPWYWYMNLGCEATANAVTVSGAFTKGYCFALDIEQESQFACIMKQVMLLFIHYWYSLYMYMQSPFSLG